MSGYLNCKSIIPNARYRTNGLFDNLYYTSACDRVQLSSRRGVWLAEKNEHIKREGLARRSEVSKIDFRIIL